MRKFNLSVSAKKYLHEVKVLFPYIGKARGSYFSNFKQLIYEYDSNHNDLSYNELVLEFGTPQQVIADYFDTLDEAQFYPLLYTRKVLAILLFIILLSSLCINLYHNYTIKQCITAEKNHTITELPVKHTSQPVEE